METSRREEPARRRLPVLRLSKSRYASGWACQQQSAPSVNLGQSEVTKGSVDGLQERPPTRLAEE
jgi:hypothetical protein